MYLDNKFILCIYEKRLELLHEQQPKTSQD